MISSKPEHLEAETVPARSEISDDPLLAYSQGGLARNEAIHLLGLRDYAKLLVALGEADLPMPLSSHQAVENQVATFVKIWQKSR